MTDINVTKDIYNETSVRRMSKCLAALARGAGKDVVSLDVDTSVPGVTTFTICAPVTEANGDAEALGRLVADRILSYMRAKLTPGGSVYAYEVSRANSAEDQRDEALATLATTRSAYQTAVNEAKRRAEEMARLVEERDRLRDAVHGVVYRLRESERKLQSQGPKGAAAAGDVAHYRMMIECVLGGG